jgi:hypothetical protein
MLFVIQLAPFITRTVLVAALTVACLNSGMAQAQELTAHEPSAPENDSAAEASKQAANPLANVWLMQIQQNTNWIVMQGKEKQSFHGRENSFSGIHARLIRVAGYFCSVGSLIVRDFETEPIPGHVA